MDDSEPIARRYVAVCDILGFSSLTTQTPLAQLATRFTKLLAHVRHSVHLNSSLFLALGEESDFVRAAVFSDTILLYSLPLHPTQSLLDIGVTSCFFDVCANLLGESLFHDMPLRIGIACGDTYVDPGASIFLGSPIVAAYETEQSQDWIGGACHTSCDDAPYFGRACSDWGNLLRYDVPHHNGYQSMWALNWARWTPVALDATDAEAYLRGRGHKKYQEAHRFLLHVRNA